MGKIKLKHLIVVVIIMSVFIWLVDGLLDFGNEKFKWEDQSVYYKWESLENMAQGSPYNLGEFYFQVAKVEPLKKPKGITVFLIVANMSTTEKTLTHNLTLKGPEDAYTMDYQAYPPVVLGPNESRNLELVFDIGKDVNLKDYTVEVIQEGMEEKLVLPLDSPAKNQENKNQDTKEEDNKKQENKNQENRD